MRSAPPSSLAPPPSGRVFRFDDGDDLFFRGGVRDGTGRRTVRIDSSLVHRPGTGAARRSLYGHLVAGRDDPPVSFAPRTS